MLSSLTAIKETQGMQQPGGYAVLALTTPYLGSRQGSMSSKFYVMIRSIDVIMAVKVKWEVHLWAYIAIEDIAGQPCHSIVMKIGRVESLLKDKMAVLLAYAKQAYV